MLPDFVIIVRVLIDHPGLGSSIARHGVFGLVYGSLTLDIFAPEFRLMAAKEGLIQQSACPFASDTSTADYPPALTPSHSTPRAP